MNGRESRIAEETVSAIDFTSRLLGAVEDGNWQYAGDKLGQLTRALKVLEQQIARTDQPAAGAPVAQYVSRASRHYRLGKALYGDTRTASEPSPLEQVEAAKRRRDFDGEIDAVRAGYQALESAPWYPARAGDIMHVHYEAGEFAPACGETYVVEHDEQEGGLVLRLLHADMGMVGPGAFAPGMVNAPLMEAWFEAGPAVLTIVRNGRIVHGQAVAQ